MKRILTGLVILAASTGIVLVGLRLAFTPAGDRANPYPYDVQQFKSVATNLMRYAEQGRIAVTGMALRALALGADGTVYAAGEALVACGQDGRALRRFALPAQATCLTEDKGMLFIGLGDRIEVYDATGALLRAYASLGSNAVLTSVAVSGDDVFAADAGNREVVHYDTGGALLGRITGKDAVHGSAGFIIPSPYFDVAIARDGTLWVVNPGAHRFEQYAFDGRLLRQWQRAGIGTEDFCGCCNPTHIAEMPDGSFVTSEKGIVRVKIVSAAGDLLSVVAAPEQFADGDAGLDLAVDAGGKVYVLDPAAQAVRIFAKK